MARKQSSIPVAVSPQTTGDFKLIKGVGPSLAGRLHNAGIHTFTQLASHSPIKLAAKVSGLSAKRIAHQDWIGQARKLIHKKQQPKLNKKETATPSIRHHYANFTIEFLLDEKNEVRRTRIVHVQSGNGNTWTGWKNNLLINFLAQHTCVHTPMAMLTSKTIGVSHRNTSQNASVKSCSMAIPISETIHPSPTIAKLTPPTPEITKRILPSPTLFNLEGTLHLRDLKVVLIDSDTPIYSLHQGQQYLVLLTLDLSKVIAPSQTPLKAKVIVSYKQLGGPDRSASETNHTIKLSDGKTLCIVGTSLPTGIYRLSAFMRLTSSDETTPGLTAFLENNLLQIY